ncbi:MAG: iron-sulfur cluster assembly accessory protein [Sphingopyxis sp.]
MAETLSTNDCPTLTASAAARVRAIGEKLGQAARLRLSVEGGGCSGFSYVFAMADSATSDDSVSETDGVALIIDSVSIDLLRGSSIDYVETLGGASFQVSNPNATAGCGCGSSFAV